MKFNRKTSRHKSSQDGSSSVIIRVTYQSKRIELYTAFTCDKRRWNKQQGRVKNGSKINGLEYQVINKKLQEMENFVDDYFNSSIFRSTQISLLDLKQRFNYKYKQTDSQLSDEFFFLFEKFIEEQSKQRGWNTSMKEAFVRLKNLVFEFNPNISFADLTISTMDSLKVKLSQTMLNEAIIKRLSYFKQFITWANKKGYQIHEEFFSYAPKFPNSKNAVKYLTREEVEKVYNLELEPFSTIDIVRDAFIFQCYTALRYSDVSALKRENIIKTEEGYELDLLTEKDDDRVRYPLSSIASKIYEKYAKYEYVDEKVFPLVSNQKYNKHLKEIGKMAELQGEWISYQYRLNEKIIKKIPKSDLCSHTARRTFITLAIEAGVSSDLIAQITSHSEIEAMKPYLAKTKAGVKKVIDALDKMAF